MCRGEKNSCHINTHSGGENNCHINTRTGEKITAMLIDAQESSVAIVLDFIQTVWIFDP